MKKITIWIFALLLVTGSVQAQQKWTLEQCIEYALRNNISIKTSELNTKSQEIKHQQAKNQRLPDLTGSYSQSLSYGQYLNSYNYYQNGNSQSYSAGLSSSVNLFNGFQTKNTIAAQHFTLLAAIEDLKKAKESIAVNIASAYLQVLYNKELYQVALEQVALSDSEVIRYENMASLGKIPEGQVYETKAQLAQDKLSATQSLSTLQLSLLDLSQLLDLKEWSNFDIAIPEIDMTSVGLQISSADEVFDYVVANKSDIKSSEYRLKSSEKNLKVTEGALYPTLYLNANYSNSYIPGSTKLNSSGAFVKANLGDQLSLNSRTSFGLSLNIPIFNRFDTENNIKLSKFAVESAKLDLESTKQTLYKEIQQAWFNATTALVKYNASVEAIKNTEEAFRFSEEKFNNGRATIYDYSEAKMKLATAKSNQLQAKYNYLFSVKILDFYKGASLHL
jgi:outer membrane protein